MDISTIRFNNKNTGRKITNLYEQNTASLFNRILLIILKEASTFFIYRLNKYEV